MTSMAPSTGTNEQITMAPCAWIGCRQLFTPRFRGQRFHSGACKAAYAREVGLVGEVASVTKLMHGKVSVTIHVPAEGEARALRLAKKGLVRVVVEP